MRPCAVMVRTYRFCQLEKWRIDRKRNDLVLRMDTVLSLNSYKSFRITGLRNMAESGELLDKIIVLVSDESAVSLSPTASTSGEAARSWIASTRYVQLLP